MRHFLFPGRARFTDMLSPYYIDRFSLYVFLKQTIDGCEKYENVLDFGCGNQPYRSLFTCDNYIGCDIENSGHIEADKKVDVYYNGHTLPFDDCSFDIILATQVFEHVEYIGDVLPELFRVLKPEGRLIITVPLCGEEHEKPYDFRRYTSFGLQMELERIGFRINVCKKSTSYRDTIRYLRLIRIDNKYRNNPSIMNRLIRLFDMLFTNLIFSLSIRKKYSNFCNDDLGLSICCVAQRCDG